LCKSVSVFEALSRRLGRKRARPVSNHISPQFLVTKLSLPTTLGVEHCWVVSFVSSTLPSISSPSFPLLLRDLPCDSRSIVSISRSQLPNCSVLRDRSPLFFLNCLFLSTSLLRTTLGPDSEVMMVGPCECSAINLRLSASLALMELWHVIGDVLRPCRAF
jgi:hypothetical protein